MGTGVEPFVQQVLTELHDLLLDLRRRAERAPPRSSGTRLQTSLALCIEASAELVDPSAGAL